MSEKKKLLIIGTVWVEAQSSAAGVRMLQLIEFFLNRRYKVVFASIAQKNKQKNDLKKLGVEEHKIALNDASFDIFVKNYKPTIVLFDRFMSEEQFGWRVAENCPDAIRILDTEDLHCLRKVREEAVKRNQQFLVENLLNATITKREIASIYRCDLSLIISTFEMELLQNLFKIDAGILHFLPFMYDKIEQRQIKKLKKHNQREHFVFVGNFLHKPNVDGVLQLKKIIWKPIRKQLPKAELHIYGAYVSKQIEQLHNEQDGFIIKGFAKNTNKAVENARVVLAPLRFGAGIKGKLTEAMLCGTPSVTTTIGAEGMHENFLWNGFVTDDFSEFSRRAVQLYLDKEIWGKAQNNGINIINNLYDKETLENSFLGRLNQLKEQLNTHRTQNFIGNMLQHHHLQSTKYMSKWIEIKNRL